MPIPETQLETWSHQGSVAMASATYATIKKALEGARSPIAGRKFEVYLQGSYKNTTNIRGDSDVDVVVQLNSTWISDIASLTPAEKARYRLAYPKATYLWAEFRVDVLKALRGAFGPGAVSEGGKALEVRGAPNRLSAHVVPCLLYRKYRRFTAVGDEDYAPGIAFYTQESRRVINFPKPHYDNGVLKQGQCGDWYKPVVRVLKNARTYLRDRGLLTDDVAPSYFVECWAHNVPSGCFGSSFQESFVNVLRWLSTACTDSMVCQNGQLPLFGDAPEQWSVDKATALRRALLHLWRS